MITELPLCLGLCIDLEEDVVSRHFSYTIGNYTYPPSLFVAISDLNVQKISKLRYIYISIFRQTTTEKKLKRLMKMLKTMVSIQEGIQMANRHMRRCSTFLIIGEMQIKTISEYHLTPVKRAIIKRSTNKWWRRCGNKESLSTLLVGMPTGRAIMENIVEVP